MRYDVLRDRAFWDTNTSAIVSRDADLRENDM